MGWDFWCDPVPGNPTVEEWARKHWAMATDSVEQEVVDVARVGSTLYVALHVKRGYPAAPFTTALVVLTQGQPKFSGFGYKEIAEVMGPVESQCPARILDRLSPADALGYKGECVTWAQQWRERCRANAAARAA